MTPLAAEAAYYRQLDAEFDRDCWIDNRVAELMADRAEWVEFMCDYENEIIEGLRKLCDCAAYERAEYATDLVAFIRERYEMRAAVEYKRMGEE